VDVIDADSPNAFPAASLSQEGSGQGETLANTPPGNYYLDIIAGGVNYTLTVEQCEGGNLSRGGSSPTPSATASASASAPAGGSPLDNPRDDLLDAGGAIKGPLPLMSDGLCPKEFPKACDEIGVADRQHRLPVALRRGYRMCEGPRVAQYAFSGVSIVSKTLCDDLAVFTRRRDIGILRCSHTRHPGQFVPEVASWHMDPVSTQLKMCVSSSGWRSDALVSSALEREDNRDEEHDLAGGRGGCNIAHRWMQ
jgi:hypothetical protein